MLHKYLHDLTTFSDEELTYKFDMLDPTMFGKSPVVSESTLGNADIAVMKHDWKMHAMYHSLELLKLSYIYSGTFLIFTDGKPTQLPPGSLCIVPPDTIQKFTIDYSQPDTEHTVMYNILIRPSKAKSLFATLFSSNNAVSAYLNDALSGKRCAKFMALKSPSDFTEDIALLAYSAIKDSMRNRNSRAYCCDLVSALIMSYFSKPDCIMETSSITNKEVEPVEKILHIIRQNYNTVTLNDLCEEFHYTPSYICRIIRKHTGMTYKEYLNDIKLDGFCREMILTDKSIKSIAEETGFHTQEHFHRTFRKKYGMPPAEYRNMLRMKLQ